MWALLLNLTYFALILLISGDDDEAQVNLRGSVTRETDGRITTGAVTAANRSMASNFQLWIDMGWTSHVHFFIFTYLCISDGNDEEQQRVRGSTHESVARIPTGAANPLSPPVQTPAAQTYGQPINALPSNQPEVEPPYPLIAQIETTPAVSATRDSLLQHLTASLPFTGPPPPSPLAQADPPNAAIPSRDSDLLHQPPLANQLSDLPNFRQLNLDDTLSGRGDTSVYPRAATQAPSDMRQNTASLGNSRSSTAAAFGHWMAATQRLEPLRVRPEHQILWPTNATAAQRAASLTTSEMAIWAYTAMRARPPHPEAQAHDPFVVAPTHDSRLQHFLPPTLQMLQPVPQPNQTRATRMANESAVRGDHLIGQPVGIVGRAQNAMPAVGNEQEIAAPTQAATPPLPAADPGDPRVSWLTRQATRQTGQTNLNRRRRHTISPDVIPRNVPRLDFPTGPFDRAPTPTVTTGPLPNAPPPPTPPPAATQTPAARIQGYRIDFLYTNTIHEGFVYRVF